MLFEPVRILFPVVIGGIAGVTASAAGSGGAVCPSTAAGGAVIYLCAAAGSGVRCARRLLQLVQSLLVLRLRCLLELVVRLLPLLCLVCLACLVLCSVRWISSLVGVGVARPVVGSTGETWLRWRFPSPVTSSRRPGCSTGLPRFSRFWTRFFFRPLLVAPSLEAPQCSSACCYGRLLSR